MIRQILMDHARRQRSAKQGGAQMQILWDGASFRHARPGGVAVQAPDDAFLSFGQIDPRKPVW